jgi:hypothetical protein
MNKYILLSLLLFGCTSEKEIPDNILGLSSFNNCNIYKEVPLIIDPDFSGTEIEQIRIGAKYWEDLVGINFGGLPISDEDCSRSNPVAGCIVRADTVQQSDYYGIPAIFLYMEAITYFNYQISGIATHEIGHYIGLPHSDDKQSVMYWRELGEDEYVEEDIPDYDAIMYEEFCLYSSL